jgi:hypothetical protein
LYRHLEQRYQEEKQCAEMAASRNSSRPQPDIQPRVGNQAVPSSAIKNRHRSFLPDQSESELASSTSPECNRIPHVWGEADDHYNRKILFYLISTLNAAFPDYDFRCVLWIIK